VTSLIPAAGTLPWRRRGGRLEVALVHRPKYDDWSWAKGKLDPGEQPSVAAVRETHEETGLVVRLGVPLPSAEYPLLDSRGAPALKQVHYWAARVTGGTGELVNEIDEVIWADVRTANDLLHYARDREQLLALVRAEREDHLASWPLALVRHTKAKPRSAWHGDDRERPLDEVGHQQAQSVAAVLGAYGVERVVSSPSTRCVQTIEPYAAGLAGPVKLRESLSEEGFEAAPEGAARVLGKLLKRGRPAAMCSHGPVLPSLIDSLATRVREDEPGAAVLVEELFAAADSGMRKGEVLVCHLRGKRELARVVAVERVDT
jgi:8-oxo-dGTP diphosphatase